MYRTVMTVVMLMLMLMLVATCGGNDDSGGDTSAAAPNAEAQRVIARSLQETGDSDPNGLQFTSTEADCAAQEIVDEVELGRLEELGLDVDFGTGPELSEPPLTTSEGDAVYAAYDACVDFTAQLNELFASDGTRSDSEARCVADAYIDSGILRRALLNPSFDEGLNDEIDAILAEADSSCTG